MNFSLSKSIKIEVLNSTVPFYTYKDEEYEYFYFDTSDYPPPDPMINLMAGLDLLKKSNQKLIMINHKLPLAVLPKIQNDFVFDYEELENGFVKIEFFLKHAK